MRRPARGERDPAFIVGYLGHLAADTFAHNHFIPYHLACFARGRQLGHLYWGMNADRFVPRQRWRSIRELKRAERLAELEMQPFGVTAFGAPTPACKGPIRLTALHVPTAGNGAFSIACTDAPLRFFAQTGWIDTGGCGGTLALSASDALRIEVSAP
jgi:hypothetical protein